MSTEKYWGHKPLVFRENTRTRMLNEMDKLLNRLLRISGERIEYGI